MLSIPAGHRQVDNSILPRGMSSYISSLMKKSLDLQEVGAYVNGRSITCIFEKGELICVEENKCFMAKIKIKDEVKTFSVEEEVLKLKPKIDLDLLASVFVEKESGSDLRDIVEEEILSEHKDYGLWTVDETPIRCDEIALSVISDMGQLDTTQSTVLHDIDNLINERGMRILDPNFWNEVIPVRDRINLYKFISRMKSGNEIHLMARGKPLMVIHTHTFRAWTDNGDEQAKTELLITPSAYARRFPLPNIVPAYGPVRWMMVSIYYLLYWVFKMLENNLGREFDSEVGWKDNLSRFRIAYTRLPTNERF